MWPEPSLTRPSIVPSDPASRGWSSLTESDWKANAFYSCQSGHWLFCFFLSGSFLNAILGEVWSWRYHGDAAWLPGGWTHLTQPLILLCRTLAATVGTRVSQIPSPSQISPLTPYLRTCKWLFTPSKNKLPVRDSQQSDTVETAVSGANWCSNQWRMWWSVLIHPPAVWELG